MRSPRSRSASSSWCPRWPTTWTGPSPPRAPAIPGPPAEDAAADLSPCPAWSCDQHRIEPILRDRARELGADLQFGHTVGDVACDADGVTAAAGTQTIQARYAVAADGARSPLRHRLGIGWTGEPLPGIAASVLFHADLTPALRGRRAIRASTGATAAAASTCSTQPPSPPSRCPPGTSPSSTNPAGGGPTGPPSSSGPTAYSPPDKDDIPRQCHMLLPTARGPRLGYDDFLRGQV